jgi:type I restriction enzyme S subunit
MAQLFPEPDRPARLADIARIGIGYTPRVDEPRFWDGGTIPFYTPEDWRPEPVHETRRWITGEAGCRINPPGAVLMTIKGPNIGKTSVAARAMACNESVAALTPKPGIGPHQVRHAVIEASASLRHRSNGSMFPELAKRDLDAAPVPSAPPSAAAAFEEFAERAWRLAAVPERARLRWSGLRESMLSAAGPLRSGWIRARLGDVAAERRLSGPPDPGMPNVGHDHLDPDDARLTRWAEGEITSFRRRFLTGDVLFGARRPNLRKAAAAPFDGICAWGFIVIRPAGVHPDLLPFIIQNADFFRYAVAVAKPSSSPYSVWADLAGRRFAMPEAPEAQARLAALLAAEDGVRRVLPNLGGLAVDLIHGAYRRMAR